MLAPTHSVFGILLTLLILAFFGVQWGMHWTIILCAVFGSIIPDIDHPRSVIGKIFYPIAGFLEHKFGHRTMTHSFIGWFIFSVIFSVFIYLGIWLSGVFFKVEFINWNLSTRWIAAFSISYFSHLALDMFNKRGVQMFWPNQNRDVIPKDPRYRLESGSRSEILIFIILLILMFLSLPVSKYGVDTSMRWLLATPGSAIEEYKSLKTHSYVEFEGYFTITKQDVKGTAEILDVDHKKLIVLFKNNIYTLADDTVADIHASKVRVKRTNDPIQIESKEFKDKTRDDLLSQIPNGALISGTIDIPSGVDVSLPTSSLSYKTIEQKGNSLVLSFASKDQIRNIGLAEKYDLQKKKDAADLSALYVRTKVINQQIKEQTLGKDLTPLGKELFLDKDKVEKQNVRIEELQSQLRDVYIKIEEQKIKMASKQLIFTGSVYVRQ